MGLVHFFAAGLLAHLPLELGDAARRPAAPDEADGRVADLDLVRDVQDLDLRVELPRLAERRVLLVDHHVARAGHVVLVQALDVQAHVVPGVREVDALVVHLHGEDLAGARVRRGVRRQEDDFLAGLHHALLHAARQDVADALDLVDPGDGHPHRGADRALGHAAQLVEDIVERVAVDRLLAHLDVHALPPRHVVGLLQEVVAHPARDGQHRGVLLDELLLPADLHQHALHLVRDLVVAGLLVAGDVAVHLVDADADLLHAEQVDQARVLASLALDLTRLVVALRNGRGEVTVRGHHDEGDISLGCAGDHVLDEVAVPRGVDDCVVPLLGVELLRRARDRHTALALLLLPVHVKSEGE
mmetsp:Transcript_49358/g.139274  ORF Transcript_49358/g.139274 Transcript_49358/m.139274 type:complete len:358 (-) Transcript_49358:240-1313(-)